MKSLAKNGNQRWVAEELKLLVNLHDAQKKSWASIAKEFGRSRHAVMRKYWALKGGYVPTKRRPETEADREVSHWTPREDAELRKMAGERHGLSYMAGRLGRSIKAVSTRLELLKQQDRLEKTPKLFDTGLAHWKKKQTTTVEEGAKAKLLKLRDQLGNEALLNLLNS